MYAFLDESGDLGFNFHKKGTSRYFVITLLACKNKEIAQKIRIAAKKTLQIKVNFKKHKNFINELKGSETPSNVRKYFYNRLISIKHWNLYTIIIDKHYFKIPKFIKTKAHLYDFFAGLLLNEIPIIQLDSNITLITDRCKTANEINKFNQYINNIISSKFTQKYKLTVYHEQSHNDKAVQAVDLFCHDIYLKYEYKDFSGYAHFKNQIILEEKK